MRRVLVTQRLIRDDRTGEERDALDVRWAPFLAASGLAPIAVPSAADPALLLAATGAEGLVLTGGNDLACVRDDSLSRRRDDVETRLLGLAEARGMPILGVCRGLQVLARRDGFDLAPVEGHVATRHTVSVEAAALRLRSHHGLEVNSFHAFAPTGTGRAWRTAARGADGCVEAIERPGRPALGIMWHPEREAPYRPEDVALFRSVFGT